MGLNGNLVQSRRSIRHRSRIGFSLVELLVVLAIVAVVMALLMPLLLKIREKSNRVRCVNNLKQIGVGIANFHSTHNQFPTQGSWWCHGIAYDAAGTPLGPKYQTAGWAFQILPFIGEQSLYDTWDTVGSPPENISPLGPGTPFPDQDAPPGSFYINYWAGRVAAGHKTAYVGAARRTAVRIYYCPSRRAPALYGPDGQNLIDYASAAPGYVPYLFEQSDCPYATDPLGLIYGWAEPEGTSPQAGNDPQYGMHHGVIAAGNWGGKGVRHTYASLTSGSANTLMIGEKWLAPQDYDGGSDGDELGPFTGTSADSVRSTATGTWTDSKGTMANIPNPSPDRNDVDRRLFAAGFGSPHADGINALFADGSVHTMKYDIEPYLLNALANIHQAPTCILADPVDDY